MLFYNQQSMPTADFKDVFLERSLKTNVVMTPATLKSVIAWMQNHLKRFEDQVGEINLQASTETEEQETSAGDPSIR